MVTRKKINIVYVTSSRYKLEENKIFLDECALPDGQFIRDVFNFEIRQVAIKEVLDVSLEVMVSEEVVQAYKKLKVPCIVEHAGLIFSEYTNLSYPGGLTKPMWNTLKDNFVVETKSSGRKAIARAVIAYCDGKQIYTFTGEREGLIADVPLGKRDFYWDTVFIPNDLSGKSIGKTYAEICEDPALGLKYKICELSQSTIAMKKFLEYRLSAGDPELWRGCYFC